MYNSMMDYLIGYFTFGFFWYTLAGILLFIVFAALSDFFVEKFRWALLYVLFGGYIVTLIGVMLASWKSSGGFFYPTEWFRMANWKSGALFTFASSRWKFDLSLPGSLDALTTGRLVNALLFVPFGFMIPLLWKHVKAKILIMGLIVVPVLEFLQVFVNRSFGLVELAMEFIGIAGGFVLFMLLFPLVKLWLYPQKKEKSK